MTIPKNYRQPVTASDQEHAARCARGRVVIIDDDIEILSALTALILLVGYACETYPSALAYMDALNCNPPAFPAPVPFFRVKCRSSTAWSYKAAWQSRTTRLCCS